MTQTTSEDTTTAPTPLPPSRELGYAYTDPGQWWTDLADEKIPELRFPQAYSVYDDMLRHYQVAAVVRAVMMPILGTPWRIDGTGCKAEITEHVAADFNLPIVGEGDETADREQNDDRFDWNEHLPVALGERQTYGHSIYEQKAYQADDGLWHLGKLGYRPPRTLTKFNVARDGGLISIEQSPGPAAGGVVTTVSTKNQPLPVRRLVVYVRDKKGGNWRGQSLLRAAYEPYMLLRRLARIDAVVAERFGGPAVVYEGPENPAPDDLIKGKAIATAIRVGQRAGAAVPNGAAIHILGQTGTGPDLDKSMSRWEEAIARAVLANFLTLNGNGAGSYAFGSMQHDFFELSLRADAKDVARVGSRHVIRDLVNWNWPGERAPRLVFDEIGSEQEALVNAIATLVGAGVLKPDESLEQLVRTTLGLPARTGPALPANPTPEAP